MELARWSGFVSSALLSVEALRACARYGPKYVEQAQLGLGGVALVPIDKPVLATAASLTPARLRTLDALHLATALSLGADLGVLVTYDERLLGAAHALDLPVIAPAG